LTPVLRRKDRTPEPLLSDLCNTHPS